MYWSHRWRSKKIHLSPRVQIFSVWHREVTEIVVRKEFFFHFKSDCRRYLWILFKLLCLLKEYICLYFLYLSVVHMSTGTIFLSMIKEARCTTRGKYYTQAYRPPAPRWFSPGVMHDALGHKVPLYLLCISGLHFGAIFSNKKVHYFLNIDPTAMILVSF